jgi:hypothetical protein
MDVAMEGRRVGAEGFLCAHPRTHQRGVQRGATTHGMCGEGLPCTS